MHWSGINSDLKHFFDTYIVWGSAVSSPSGVWGGAPEALAFFMFLESKIQHLINITAPNLLKLTSRKRDMHERK